MEDQNSTFATFLLKEFFDEDRHVITYPNSEPVGKWGNPSIDQVLDHLDGKIRLSFFKDPQATNLIIFELNVLDDLLERVFARMMFRIILVFGMPNLILRSPYNDLYLYYLLDNYYATNEIREFFTDYFGGMPCRYRLFPDSKSMFLLAGGSMPIVNARNQIITSSLSEIETVVRRQWQSGRKINPLKVSGKHPSEHFPFD